MPLKFQLSRNSESESLLGPSKANLQSAKLLMILGRAGVTSGLRQIEKYHSNIVPDS